MGLDEMDYLHMTALRTSRLANRRSPCSIRHVVAANQRLSYQI
jgi:hypothetical protein